MPQNGTRLTPITITNAKPRAQRYAIPDSGCRGLYLNVHPSGRKSWSVRYRIAGATKNLTLDGFPPLAQARKAATEALADVAQGKDPAAAKLGAKAAARAAADTRARDTVERLAKTYIEQHAKRHTRYNSWRATGLHFKNHLVPAWGERCVRDITRRDVIDLTDQIALKHPTAANRVKAAASRFFRWLADRDVIAASPCVGLAAPAKETPRDRLLNDDELRRLWRACDAIGEPAGTCIKLLILTGQRRSEIAGLRWDELDGDLLTLPAERMKGRAAHTVPLSAQAAALIAAQPHVGDYVFGRSPLEHFDRIKRGLDTHMGAVPKWVVHDIRRTTASGMAKIGVPVAVIEKILAHATGTFRGVVGVYQRHSFLPEMTIAMQRFADHIEQLVGGKSATVVKLPQRR